MRKRRRRSRSEWTKLVAQWRASGLSQRVFAGRKGLASASLSWWVSCLRREERGRRPLGAACGSEAWGRIQVDQAGGGCHGHGMRSLKWSRNVSPPGGYRSTGAEAVGRNC